MTRETNQGSNVMMLLNRRNLLGTGSAMLALAAIHGVGAAKLERFGADVCRLCTES